MNVYEGRLKVFLLKDISINSVQEKISALIDKALVQNEKMAAFHQKISYKNYCFSGFYPVESERVYIQTARRNKRLCDHPAFTGRKTAVPAGSYAVI